MNVDELINGLKGKRPELFRKDSGETLYCDGGVIGRNPSDIGGTYAFILVAEDGESVLREGQGVIAAYDCGGVVTNNVSELLACLYGLEGLTPEWTGRIASDSQVTLGRLCDGWGLEGVPDWVQMKLARYRHVMELADRQRITPLLLAGHPSKKDLERGHREKDGLPVSKWNVECDRRCKALAAEVMQKITRQAACGCDWGGCSC